MLIRICKVLLFYQSLDLQEQLLIVASSALFIVKSLFFRLENSSSPVRVERPVYPLLKRVYG